MNANEFKQLESMMMNEFQVIYGIDIRHLCRTDGIAKPMRFHVGYDASNPNNREYEFTVEIPCTVYKNGTSQEIVRYIINCVKEEMSKQDMATFEAPSEETAVWCDEI